MTDKSCPDPRLLEQLLLGRLPADRAANLEEHFSGCELCAERAGQIHGEDELIVALQAKQLPAEDDGRVAELIEHLRDVNAEAETSRLGDTHTLNGNRSVASLAELSELLDAPEQPDEIGRIGQYRVLDVLDVGGMGIVLRAEDPHLKRRVAIKVIKGDVAADESAKSRFLREAQATAAIEQDNIVTIYQVGEHRGAPYYAMQFLRGESLEDRLKRNGELPQSDVLRIGREIAQGLAAAHAVGLLHRDIKPDNIWLEEKTDRAKIVDFGLARPTDDDENMTMTGAVLGTPRYMAPEQAQGKSVDARCDLFSLGCVMYHLATGRPPFAGENVVATLMAVVNNQPQPVLEAQPQLDSKLAVVIERLLAKDPAARFQSADEVVQAIRRIEQRLADQQRREEEKRRSQPTPAELHLQSQRRRRVMIGTALVAGLLAIACGVIFVIQTQTGTVRVEVNGDHLEVLIDETKITLTDKEWKGRKRAAKHQLAIKLRDQTLNIGKVTVFKVDGSDVEHRLTVKLNGFDITSDEFEVVRGDNTVLTIAYEETKVASAPQDYPTASNYALEFDGEDDFVETPLKYDGTHPITIEAHIMPMSDRRRRAAGIISNAEKSGLGFYLDGDYWRASGYSAGSKGAPRVSSPGQPELGRRVHVAVTYDLKKLTLFIAGQSVGSVDLKGQHLASSLAFTIGADAHSDKGQFHFRGLIDEVRISKVVRYFQDFPPIERFEPDDDTLVLYHFDEGAGSDAKDASKNGYDAKITGATWVRSDGSPAHVLPSNAPPLAIAPFEEPEAKAHQQAWADYLGLPVEKEVELPGGEKMTFMLIPPGEFMMGKADVAQAKFTRPFYLGQYEVTQAQWQGVMGSNPSQFQDSPAHPVEQVSWEEIQPFLAKLNEDASADEVNFALPTEAQWEFACRAGTTTSWYCGDSEDDLRQYGWFKANSRRTTYPVGQLKPNALGLYDMHGNVWEWCDGHKDRFRLIRGGSWFDPGIRSAGRIATLGTRRTNNAGFRLAASIELPEQPAVTAAVEPYQLPADAPTMAIAPFEAEHAKQHQQAWADYLGLPVEKEVELPRGEKMTFMLIPPGEFMMGSTDEDRARWLKKATAEKDKWSIERLSDEGPQHRVRLTRAFYLAAHEVTQEQYQQIMGENPSYFSSSGEGKDAVAGQTTHRHPVENVTWRDAVSFCNKLSALEKRRPNYVTSGTSVTLAGGNGYRLPTEAEWEYACRAGGTGAFCFADESKLGNYAWYDVNSAGSTHPVGEKLPNGFGAYDMHGNVWEWCWDWWDAQQYLKRKGGGDVLDPFGPDAGSRRVYRGGFWFFNAGSCRSAIRGHSSPNNRFNYLGFRLAMSIDTAKLKSASATIAPEDGWTDLMVAVDVTRDADPNGGSWRIDDGELVGIYGLSLPVIPLGSYEWEVEFTPALGSGPLLNFTFPHQYGRAYVAVIDKPGIHDWHPTSARKFSRLIKAAPAVSRGEKHILKIQFVTQDAAASITATIDGAPWAEWSGNAKSLASDSLGSRKPAMWSSSQLTIHSTRFRMLVGKATLQALPNYSVDGDRLSNEQPADPASVPAPKDESPSVVASDRWQELGDKTRAQAEQIATEVNRRVDAGEFGVPVDTAKVEQFIQRELDRRKREGLLSMEADIQLKLNEQGKVIGRTITFRSLPPR